MQMNAGVVWLVVAAVLAIAELVLGGTFYLLVLALAALAGALAVELGAPVLGQMLAVAVAAVLFYFVLRQTRLGRVLDASTKDAAASQGFDVGAHVAVDAWGPDGRVRVQYRGSWWDAQLASGARAQPGMFVVVAMDGNTLVLNNLAAPAS
ncbi:MAG: NfeD family protein, partial [Candidatus Protistobacter heckmanni]|nr:NfeD family protein [Candidatus Protistobacter heckmanni]